MPLPSVHDLQVAGKAVLLRTNYDVPLERCKVAKVQRFKVSDGTRIEESVETVELLLKKGAEKIIVMSHLGRPGGKIAEELSLEPVVDYLNEILRIKNKIQKEKIEEFEGYRLGKKIVLLENLRFWAGEEENDKEFVRRLAELGDVYVNDAFACSHRKHASIVGLPEVMPAALGLDMVAEIETLSRVREKPKRPVVLLLGGTKPSKIEAARKLISWADWVLVGGKLVEYDGLPELLDHPKIDGNLLKSGEDITMETAEKFAGIIARAGTVVWAGPMGNFYETEAEAGTRIVGEAVVKSGAFSIIGGGDTEAALTKFGLVDKIDYVSSGGGAMLEFLAEGTLPGIEAIAGNRKS